MIGGGQTINLGNGCHQKSTVIHEIGHALGKHSNFCMHVHQLVDFIIFYHIVHIIIIFTVPGLHHEQNRPDRDTYVNIHLENLYNSSK